MEEEREGVSWNPNILVLTRNRGRTQSQQCLKTAWVCSDCRRLLLRRAYSEFQAGPNGYSSSIAGQLELISSTNSRTTTNLSIWLSCSKIWSDPARCVFLLLLLLHFLLLLWLMLGPPTITSMLPCSAKSLKNNFSFSRDEIIGCLI